MLSWIEWVDAFAAGVYLLFGVVHLDLWLRRRERRGHLWLALAALGALSVNLSGFVIRRDGGEALGRWLLTTNLLGVALATVCLYELVGALRARPTGRGMRAIQVVTLAAALAGGLLFVRAAMGLILVLCFVLLVAGMVRAFAAARDGDRDTGVVARGLLVLIGALVLDVLMGLQLIPMRAGLPVLGFVVLFLASAKSLADRADREESELQSLRRELERRVVDRTEELREANVKLAEASRTDALTGLPNRRGLLELAGALLPASRRAGTPVAVLLADIDHFKRINDTRGHAVGDAVLREVATALRAALRAEDLVARWGGEEFLILLPGADATGALAAAETLRAAVAGRDLAPYGWDAPVTLSIGVARHDPTTPLDPTIAAADAALYRAKQSGRDRSAGAEAGT